MTLEIARGLQLSHGLRQNETLGCDVPGPSRPTGLRLPAKPPQQQQPLSPPSSLTQNTLWLFTELIHRPPTEGPWSSPDPGTFLPIKLGHRFLPGSAARSLMCGFCRRPPANSKKFQKAGRQKGRPSIFFPWHHIKYQGGVGDWKSEDREVCEWVVSNPGALSWARKPWACPSEPLSLPAGALTSSHPSLCPWKAHSHVRTSCVHHVLMALGKMQEGVCSVALLHDPGGQGGWGARLRTRGLICCVSSDKLLALSVLQHFSRTVVTAGEGGDLAQS